jgi:hypothetical protein
MKKGTRIMANNEQDQARDTQAIRKERDEQGKTQGDPFEKTVDRMAGFAPHAGNVPESSPQPGQQAGETTQSDASLSGSSDNQSDDGRFSIAEEQNFDQQSDQARRVGQMPRDAGPAGAKPSDAMAKATTGKGP